MRWVGRLLSPLNYLRIRHETKPKYDWGLPAGLALGATIAVYILPIQPNIFGVGGVLEKFGQLLQILPGFYIAALAAISTFNKADMDERMPEDAPTLEITYRGKPFTLELTRRRFLSAMFGYLSFLSIALYITTIVANVIAPSLAIILPASLHTYFKFGFVAFYMFGQANMLVTTLLGLYYLADRIHLTDQHTGRQAVANDPVGRQRQ